MPAEPTQKHPVPWRGRKRVADAKDRFVAMRCKSADYQTLKARADQAGLSVGAFLRAVAFGSPGPRAVRRVPIEREQLARLLGEIGKLGSNVNQIAHWANQERASPRHGELPLIKQDIAAMRSALMHALGRGD